MAFLPGVRACVLEECAHVGRAALTQVNRGANEKRAPWPGPGARLPKAKPRQAAVFT